MKFLNVEKLNSESRMRHIDRTEKKPKEEKPKRIRRYWKKPKAAKIIDWNKISKYGH